MIAGRFVLLAFLRTPLPPSFSSSGPSIDQRIVIKHAYARATSVNDANCPYGQTILLQPTPEGVITLYQILEHWINIRLFEQHWSSLLTCHNEHEHNYIQAQPTAYHNLEDYVLIWRAIISNEIFHEIFKFVDDRTYWEETYAPAGMLVDTSPGTGGNR